MRTPGVGFEADVDLAHRKPIDTDDLFAWMVARAIPGVEVATPSSYARALRLPGGPARFELTRTPSSGIRLRACAATPADLREIQVRARRLFGLDHDPHVVDEALARHPELAPLVAAAPGVRVAGTTDPHEMLVRAMVGQQITVAAARTALTALTEALGERIPDVEGTYRLFPTMRAIAEHGHEVLRGPAARVRSLIGAAATLAEGSLVLTFDDDGPTQRAALLAMPGIGPWTADYVRMRVLGDPDVTLPGDVAVRAGAAAIGIPSDPKGFAAWAARTSPWRSFLTAHLWRAAPVRPRSARGSSARTNSTDPPPPRLDPGLRPGSDADSVE